jgi:hypothetical protein
MSTAFIITKPPYDYLEETVSTVTIITKPPYAYYRLRGRGVRVDDF